jgi:hypothetical protein
VRAFFVGREIEANDAGGALNRVQNGDHGLKAGATSNGGPQPGGPPQSTNEGKRSWWPFRRRKR